MARRSAVVCALALVLVLGGVLPVAADAGTMSTAFVVQNLGSDEATVTVDYLSASGTQMNQMVQTVSVGAHYIFDQRYASGYPGADTFSGSAVVYATQPVGAVVNMVRSGGTVPSHESYSGLGVDDVGTHFMIPQVLKGVTSLSVQWNTTLVIQNTDLDNVASVSVVFVPNPRNVSMGGTLSEPYTYTIPGGVPAGGSVVLDQTTTPSSAEIGALFFGSARVEADRDIAVVAYADGGGRVLMAYPCFAAGTTDSIALPSIYKNISSLGDSYSTAMLLVNFGDADATVEIEYLPASGAYTVSGTDMVTVPAGGVLNVDQRYDAASITSGSFMGAATVTVQNGQPIQVMVNLRGGSRYGMTYGGLASGGMVAYLPIAYKTITSQGLSWSSAILLQSLESGQTSAQFTFYPSGASPIVDPTSYTFSGIGQFDLRYTTAVSSRASFIGAVKVETDKPVAVFLQTRGAGGSGDAFMGYRGLTTQ